MTLKDQHDAYTRAARTVNAMLDAWALGLSWPELLERAAKPRRGPRPPKGAVPLEGFPTAHTARNGTAVSS